MKILVVSPHPDDESIGAGGTLLRLKDEGHSIYWLNITTVEGNDNYNIEFVNKRRNQIEKVKKSYNFDGYYSLDFATSRLDSVEDSVAIERISEVFNAVEPEIIIIPDNNDVHSDHKIVHEWCISCSKWFRFPFIKTILSMEIVSETDFGIGFIPCLFIDISEYLERKIEIVSIYESEMGQHPFPRSIDNIKALATVRGAMSGSAYAEAFRVIKMIL